MADLASKQLLPKSVRIAAGAVVCVESEIRGQVTIGTRTVIHPKARILADAGPIIIGENNLIEEQVVIINRLPDKNPLSEKNEMEPVTMVIGTNNVFEVGCQSEALKIGDYNTIESKAMVGRSTVLSSGCVVGACCKVNTDEVIPENTVVFGERCLRRTQSEKPQSQSLQLDFLMKILPNYHHLKKPKAATPAKV